MSPTQRNYHSKSADMYKVQRRHHIVFFTTSIILLYRLKSLQKHLNHLPPFPLRTYTLHIMQLWWFTMGSISNIITSHDSDYWRERDGTFSLGFHLSYINVQVCKITHFYTNPGHIVKLHFFTQRFYNIYFLTFVNKK
jgi:hypothetical protein